MKIIATIQNESVIAAWGGHICRSVVLSEERIAHINERHPGVYEVFRDEITATIEQPDYVFDDLKNVNTAVFIRESARTNLNVVVRLALEDHPAGTAQLSHHAVSDERKAPASADEEGKAGLQSAAFVI